MEACLAANAAIPSGAIHGRITRARICHIERRNRRTAVYVGHGTEFPELVGFSVRVHLQIALRRKSEFARTVFCRAPFINVTVGREAESGTRFPFLSNAGRKVMTNVSAIVENELCPLLQDTKTPDDVRYFKSEDGNAEGSTVIRAGKDSFQAEHELVKLIAWTVVTEEVTLVECLKLCSLLAERWDVSCGVLQIDFVLESWLHAKLPSGTLDIATIVVMLGPETDSPHFLFEFIQSGPSLVVVLDHVPRKDLVLDTDYQQRFYEAPGLDEIRKLFEEAPNSKPYISPTLFVRSIVSPTAVLYKLNAGTQVDGGGLEEQIETVVYSGSQKMTEAWIESFLTRGSSGCNLEDTLKRDNKIKTFGFEVDLSANLPRLFGKNIADRVVEAFRTGGRIKV
ncbi:hypothetical protein R1sor_025897 [Riccia sorocarpa]|uniref:Red chlorophyll catabolite reductase n=1 Tax=Riccia sorocarpa TaxID=122646 RepID=A0ABD3GFI6_9MARC